MAPFKLVVTMSGNEATVLSEHSFDKDQVAIGRAAGNDVVLPDVEKRVSSRHARIERRGSSCQLMDLGSTNGTFLNDRKLEPNSASPLKDGDRFAVGLYHLRFMAAEEPTEQTMVMVDPSRLTARLAEELPVLYARRLGDPPEERRAAIREAVRQSVGTLGPEQARSVLVQLQSRFRPGEAKLVPERTTEVRRKDVEIQQRESLFQAGARAVSEISQRLLGEAKFETPEQVELFGTLLAQAMELSLEWLSKSLKGRKEFEGQFSADLSMIFSAEKNPLKGGGGPQDMAKFLFDWRSPRSAQGAREALESAFKDLTMHQLGLLAGVQESLSAVLRRLDPKAVEGEVKEKGGGGMFASLEKRAWKRYSEVFTEIFAENSKLFNEMIYPNVRKGYLGLHSAGGPEGEKAPAPKQPPVHQEGTQK